MASAFDHSPDAETLPNADMYRSMGMVKSPSWWRGLAIVLISLFTVVCLGLVFIPWQQSVTGIGRVTVYSPDDRPQNVDAQIPGRIKAWHTADGQWIKKGDVLVELDDIDSKFLNPELVMQARKQRDALVAQKDAAAARVKKLTKQFELFTVSRDNAIPIAGQRAERAGDLVKAAEETLEQSKRSRDVIKETQIQAANERAQQAEETRLSMEEALKAAKQRMETEKMRRERVRQLFEKKLRSQQDDEFSERDLVVAQTEVIRAERSLAAAERAVNVAKLDRDRARIDLERAESDVRNKEAALEAAKRDKVVGGLDVEQVGASTGAQLAAIEAAIEAGNETIAKADESIVKLEQDISNFERRLEQRLVRAPRDGRVVRLTEVGAGATVKAGDTLAVLAPDTADQAVELFLSDHDAPLVDVGRPVRLQFAGYPAIQVTGFPSVAVGTFAGVVANVDQVDDGGGRFRVLIKPDTDRIKAGYDEPWPKSDRLRPGGKSVGWVLLDTVSLGFELWRRFNAFPPSIQNQKVAPIVSDKKAGKSDSGEKMDYRDKGAFDLKPRGLK